MCDIAIRGRTGFAAIGFETPELLVEEIASWGIYETTRRKAEAVIKARLAATEAAQPKFEPAPGSMEYQALHPDWKPQED